MATQRNGTNDPVDGMDQNTVPPFCFGCFEMNVNTTTLYFVACGRILCTKCLSRLAPNDGQVKCSAHNKFEKYIPINEKMPNHLRNIFRNDDEKDLKQIATNMEFMTKLNNELGARLAKLPPDPNDESIRNGKAALDLAKTNIKKLDKDLAEEQEKLKRDLKAVEKMDQYVADYERRAKKAPRETSTSCSVSSKQPPAPPAGNTQFVKARPFISPISREYAKQSTNLFGKRTVGTNDSGYQTSLLSDLLKKRSNIAKSTPLSNADIELSETSSLYTQFRRNLNRNCPSIDQTTPKSILKNNSSSRRSSSTGGTSTFVSTPGPAQLFNQQRFHPLYRGQPDVATPNDLPKLGQNRRFSLNIDRETQNRIGTQTHIKHSAKQNPKPTIQDHDRNVSLYRSRSNLDKQNLAQKLEPSENPNWKTKHNRIGALPNTNNNKNPPMRMDKHHNASKPLGYQSISTLLEMRTSAARPEQPSEIRLSEFGLQKNQVPSKTPPISGRPYILSEHKLSSSTRYANQAPQSDRSRTTTTQSNTAQNNRAIYVVPSSRDRTTHSSRPLNTITDNQCKSGGKVSSIFDHLRRST